MSESDGPDGVLPRDGMFFCAQFVNAFGQSNLGALLAVKGAAGAQGARSARSGDDRRHRLPDGVRQPVRGLGQRASGRLLAPIFVPMLMQVGISPDLTQAAYRVGDSSTNIITPLMPYFPLVVVYCQRYVKNTGIGTLAAMMLPYSVWFITTWTVFLLDLLRARHPARYPVQLLVPVVST